MEQIVTYNKGTAGVFSQIKLESGERILISIAQPSIRVYKLILWGNVLAKIIWEYKIDTNEPENIKKLIRMFSDPQKPQDHPLDAIINKIINCKSITDVKKTLDDLAKE